MMCDHDLPTSLWEEASITTAYIENKIPYAISGEKTPKQVFTGEKIDVGQLNIFGFLVYIHVPKGKRTKMEPFGNKGTFFGYS